MQGHDQEGEQPNDHNSGHGSDSGACAKPTHKRSKSKSKVWEKVAWFTRKSRSRETPSEEAALADPDMAALPLDVMELDIVPSESSTDPYPLNNSSNASSDSELFEDLNYDGCHIKRSRLYPNSEVVEQNCLRPSMARALFNQLEAANQRIGKPSKYAWIKKKKHGGGGIGGGGIPRRDSFHSGSLNVLGDESLARALSMPSEITEKSSLCHCMACCSCTPSQRLMGACPAYARLSMSTTSLDTGLDLTTDTVQCTNQSPYDQSDFVSTDGANKEQLPTKKIQNQFVLDFNQYKSNSLPSSYGKRCKVCNQPQAPKSHLPFTGRQSTDLRYNLMVGTSGGNFCQCKRKNPKKLTCQAGDSFVPSNKQDRSPLFQDGVSAQEFKSRKEVSKDHPLISY